MNAIRDDGDSLALNRRQMIAATAAGAASLFLSESLLAESRPDWFSSWGRQNGFLSAGNPIATKGQIAVENRAISLLERPEIIHAREVASHLFKWVDTWPLRDDPALLDSAIDEHIFHHVLRATNGDPNYPQVTRFMVPPHHWFGRDVPGSRWGGDSPDFIYRTIPFAHGGRYEIHGVRTCAEAPIVFYALMGDNTAAPQVFSLLESPDMEIAADGSFTITLDETPPDGRRNHIQTKPGTEFMMIRDAIGDWIHQSPNALTVKRLNPDGDPRSDAELAQRAVRIALDGIYYAYFNWAGGQLVPPNSIAQPFSTGSLGAIATQVGTMGRIELEPDDALVVRANAANANFRNVFLFDLCQRTHEYWKRTGSFNMKQMAADEDGNFTYVVAHRDPGVHNWLDTGGLRRTLIGQRWQSFARGQEHEAPWMTMQQVKFDALDKALPKGIRRIDAAGRKAQVSERETGFKRRFLES
jgi:uncharacterized protein DUF1214